MDLFRVVYIRYCLHKVLFFRVWGLGLKPWTPNFVRPRLTGSPKVSALDRRELFKDSDMEIIIRKVHGGFSTATKRCRVVPLRVYDSWLEPYARKLPEPGKTCEYRVRSGRRPLSDFTDYSMAASVSASSGRSWWKSHPFVSPEQHSEASHHFGGFLGLNTIWTTENLPFYGLIQGRHNKEPRKGRLTYGFRKD